MKKILALILSVITLLGAISLVGCSKEFTVTFDANEGRQVASDTTDLIQVVKDAAEIVPPQFERPGYDFNGWSVAIDEIEEDTVVKAEWKEKTYTISFDKNGGVWGEGFTDDYTLSANYGKAVSGKFPTVTKEGYKFEKWVIVDDDETLNGKYFSDTAEFAYTKDIKVKAEWTVNANYVIFYVDAYFEVGKGKTSFSTTDEEFDLDTPIKVGYDFEGWVWEGNSTPQKKVTIKPSDSNFHKNLTYTAKWTLSENYLTIKLESTYTDVSKNRTISYTINGRSELIIAKSETIDSLNIAKPAFVNKVDEDDYSFSYWAYKSSDDKYYNIKTVVASDDIAKDGVITLYPVCRYAWIGPY